MKKVFRKMLFLMVLVFALGSAASFAADVDLVYLTTALDYSESAVGVADSQSGMAYPERVTGLGSDVAAFEIEVDGEKRVLVRSHTVFGDVDDLVRVYDPMDWSEPIVPAFRAGRNIRNAVTSGNMLYLVNYDTATVTAHDMDASFELVDSCDLSGELSLTFYKTYAQDMEIVDGNIFVLLQSFNQDWPPAHQNGAVYKLNNELNIVSSLDVGKNPFSLESYGDYLFVSNFGGAQYVTSSDIDTSVDRIEIDTFPANREVLLTSNDIGAGMSFADIAISDSGSDNPGTMLLSVLDNSTDFFSAEYTPYFSSGDITSDFSIVSVDVIPGWVNMIKYDIYNDLFWVNVNQDKIKSFETVGTPVDDLTQTDLGGLPVAVLPIEGGSDFNGPEGSTGSGGGCNVAGAGMGSLLLILPLLGLMLKRSR